MLDRIVLSKDKKSATLIFTNRTPFVLSSDSEMGLVYLIEWYLSPKETKKSELTWSSIYLDDTQEIDIKEVA